MRKLLYALAAVLVVLVAIVFVGPSLVDWNAHKDLIAAEVRAETGRDLAIRGDMQLALLPVPALSAAGVGLANIDGGSPAPMVELKELRVRIALFPLLQGKVQVQRIALVEPKILLEVLPDGRRNWEFGTAEAPGPGTGAAGASAVDVQFDDFSIENGMLVYRDHAAGREERVQVSDARIVAESLRGPFAAKGNIRVRGIDTDFEATVGRLVDEGATPFNVLLKLTEAAARIHFSGALSVHPETLALRGRLSSEGENLAAVVDALSGESGRAPAFFAQDFAAQGEVSADPQALSVSQLDLRLGATELSGDVVALAAPPYDARISLSAPRIDLDRLIDAIQSPAPQPEEASEPSGAGRSGASARGTGGNGGPGTPGASWAMPAGIAGRVEIAVEALIYRGQVVHQLRFDASLADGRATVERAMALLPGSSDLSFTGEVSESGGAPRFSGHIEAASDNLRGLFDWFGVDVGRVPPDRLRRMSLSSRIEATPERITIGDIDFRVDLSRVSGGVVIVPRARPGLGIGLAVDSINLDAYLPSQPLGAGGGAEDSPGAQTEEANAGAGGLAILDAFDANLDLRARGVTLRGVTAKDVHVDATLKNAAVEFRTARVGDLAGSEISYVGKVGQLARAPALDGAIELAVGEPARLARLLGVEPGDLAGVPAFTAAGQVKGDLNGLTVDGEVTAMGGRFGLSGSARPAATPPEFDLSVAAKHPNLAQLAAALGGPEGLDPALGGLDVKARVHGDAGQVRVDDLAGRLGPTDLTGRLAADLTGPRLVLAVDLDAGTLPLDPWLGGGSGKSAEGKRGERWSRDAIDLGGLQKIDAQLTVNAAALTHEDLRIDQARLEASLNDGLLDVKRFAGTFYGGAVQVAGTLDARATPEAGFAVTAIEVDVGALLREQADFDRVAGPVSLNADLTTRGRSEAELISGLTGRGDISGEITVRAKTEEQVGGVLLGILGTQIARVRGLTDVAGLLLNSFAGAPATLTGSFTAERGVLRTRDTRLDGRGAEALTKATVDLPAWTIDSQTDVFQATAPQTPSLTVGLRGPVDDPNVKLGGAALQTPTLPSVQEPAAPAPSGPAPTAPQPSSPAPEPTGPLPVQPEDVIKDLLKGFGG